MTHDLEGSCYCGSVRYAVRGEVTMRLRCYCRECQYISGGSSAEMMVMPKAGFRLSKGETKAFRHPDEGSQVTRRFCGDCGTHLVSSSVALPDARFIKVGTLDDPSVFERPDLAVFTSEKQCFHLVAADVPSFDRYPG